MTYLVTITTEDGDMLASHSIELNDQGQWDNERCEYELCTEVLAAVANVEVNSWAKA